MKETKTGPGCLTKIITIAAVLFVVWLATALVSSYGFAAGGGEINAFSPNSAVEVQGDNNGAVISIVGDGNEASATLERKQANDRALLTVVFALLMAMPMLYFVFWLASKQDAGLYYD